jgi:hypothetical protein
MKSGSAPGWAIELALRVCAEAGVAPPHVLRWRRADRELSTGLTRHLARSIAVTAGRDPDDARHTTLHELAHWLTPDPPRRRRRGQAVHHGRAFYAVALDLYARYDPDPVAALRREAVRYPSALHHARALAMPGVEALMLERRSAQPSPARVRARWRVLIPEHSIRLVRTGRWYVCSTCGRRLVARALLRAARRGSRDRHTLWTRDVSEASA